MVVRLVIGSSISCDYVPVSIVARGGFKGYFLFREMKCEYIMAVLVSAKTQFLKSVLIVKAFFAQYGHKMQSLIVDAGTVEKATVTKRSLNLEGITIQEAPPECQFQNPVERSQLTIANAMTAALCDQDALDNTC